MKKVSFVLALAGMLVGSGLMRAQIAPAKIPLPMYRRVIVPIGWMTGWGLGSKGEPVP
jgi:hypothetical protein